MKKYIGVIIGIVIVVIGIVVISLNGKTIDYKQRSVDEWYNDIVSNKDVLTVFGASYCSHCQEYYPVISKLANKYNINLYFFELDELEESKPDDYNKLINSFEIKDFDAFPFTFLMRDGDYTAFDEGYIDRDHTISFLENNGLIKD